MAAPAEAAHEAAGREEQAAASARTYARASILVNAYWGVTPGLAATATALTFAVAQQLGEDVVLAGAEGTAQAEEEDERVETWSAFLGRWKYDEAQVEKIKVALAQCRDDAGLGEP